MDSDLRPVVPYLLFISVLVVNLISRTYLFLARVTATMLVPLLLPMNSSSSTPGYPLAKEALHQPASQEQWLLATMACRRILSPSCSP